MRCLIVLALLALLAGSARAEIVHYLGPHPISPRIMRGMCYIEGPHIHDYVPHKPILYVQAGDSYAFVGDPTEFEVESPRYSYYGHHPVFWANVEVGAPPPPHICYITGPHHHWYAPPPEIQFVARGGAYWYVGPMPPGYVRRWHRHSPVDDYYGHVTLLVPAPVITIAPPEGFVGFYFGPGYYRGRAYHGGYYGPRVGVGVQVVAPPPPSVYIGGGVQVGGGAHVYPGHHPPAWGRGGAPPGHVGGNPGHGGGHPGRGHGGRGH